MRISDPRSLRSWKIKWTDDSTGQKFIGSFGLPWSKWSGNSDPSESLSSQRSTHPKWHQFLSKQFIGQTPLHHIHKFSFHWNLVIQKQPDTVRNPISYKSLPQFPVWYLECMGRHQGCSCEWLITTSQCECCLCRHVESPYFLELGSSNGQIETTAKRAGIRDAVVNGWSQQVSVSAACVGMLSLLISWSWVPPITRLKLQQKGQVSGMLL